MVTHGTLVKKFGDSPAIIMAKRVNKAAVCLNYIEDEWVLTWTTGGNETITIRDVKHLKVEPLFEEKLTFIGLGPKNLRCFKSEGATSFDPNGCPWCYDGLSFKRFSEIECDLANEANFYLNWDHIASGNQFTYRM